MPVTKVEGKKGTSYRVRVELPADPVTGRRQWFSETFTARRDAERREREVRVAVESRTYTTETECTLTEFMVQFRARTGGVRDSTWYRNGQDIRLRILPALGDARITDLRVAHVQQFVDDLEDDYAPATIRRTYSTLHSALDQAVGWGLLAANPCMGVRLPRIDGTEMRVWNEGQVATFLRVTAHCPFAALWRLALLVGMRKGELLALQWGDLDLPRRTLRVQRTMTRDKDLAFILGPPKTRAGTRTIKLPLLCVTALTAHQECCVPVRHEGFVFPRDGDDAMMLSNTMPNRMLERYAKEAQLPRLRFHDLRHTAATLMLLQGISARVVQERMGHASIAITLGLYSHVTLTMQDDAADKMDAMFTPDDPHPLL